MALNNRPNRTSPTLRGHFVRERLLCGTVPPPPPNIPAIDESAATATQTLREKLEAHRNNPACSGCHKMMDPLGLGMEDFDRYGRFRTKDDTAPPSTTEETSTARCSTAGASSARSWPPIPG